MPIQSVKRHFKKHEKRIKRIPKHPLIIPVVTFFVLFFISIILFINSGGSTFGPSDARLVTVYVDSQKQTVPTRAQNVSDLLKRLGVDIKQGDVVEPAQDAAITQDGFTINIYRAREVTLIDNGAKKLVKSADQSPRSVARQAGITLFPEDEVVPTPSEDIINEGVKGERYVIDRALPVTLIVYGNVVQTRTQSTTVGELLDEQKISLKDGDAIEPKQDAALVADQKIIITRPGQKIATTEEVIPFETEYINDANVLAGTTTIQEAGQNGKKIVTYDVQVDEQGKEVSRKVIREIVALKPVKQIVVKGTKLVITDPSDNVKLGEQLAAGRGWTGQQWYCLYSLWQKESRWRTTAGNPSSGAYGIPQALPASKMASAGPNYLTDPSTQINWGLGYIAGRYGTPCGAWNQSQANNWY